MTATVVTINRLSARATARDADDERALRTRLPLLLDRAGRGRLPAVLTLNGHDAGHTCVRRLDVRLMLHSDESDDRIADGWARALAAAVRSSVDTRTSAIVHYASDLEALVDLVVSVAAGRWDREWAWRQVGLFDDGVGKVASDSPTAAASHPDPRSVVLSALAKRPELVAKVVAAVAAEVGVATIDRLVGSAGWVDLAVVVAKNFGVEVRPDRVVRANRAVAVPQGRLTHAFVRTSLRASRQTRTAWAILALAADAPGLLRGEDRAAVLTTLALRFAAGAEPAEAGHYGDSTRQLRAAERAASPADKTDRPPVDEPDADAGVGTDHGPSSGAQVSDKAPMPAEARAPDQTSVSNGRDAAAEQAADGTAEGVPTAYAGLLFLLATAADAGVPSRLLGDSRLATRSPSWCLHRVGLALAPAQADDPAVLALAGVAPGRQAELDAAEPGDDEIQAVAETAQAWRAATALRIREHDASRLSDFDDVRVVARVVERAGRVRHEPGWVEVVLDVADTDVLIRRAGLDLDPGWVPWLGMVVRYRYE